MRLGEEILQGTLKETLYDWPVIERDMKTHSRTNSLAMRPANDGEAAGG